MGFANLASEHFDSDTDFIDRLYLSSPLIKLIAGPRCSGKSVLALQILENKSFAYMNFDDDLLLKNFEEDSVSEALNEVYPDYDYLLLDEIQNLNRWELWVTRLYRRSVNLVITGSNARLLKFLFMPQLFLFFC